MILINNLEFRTHDQLDVLLIGEIHHYFLIFYYIFLYP